MTYEIRNAIITSVTLSTEDHGCLSSFVNLDYGGEAQGFGGYALYSPGHPDSTGHWIWRICEVIGVGRWEHLKGQPCRVKATHTNIEAIGNILTDKWFYPREEFKALHD